MLTIYFVAVKIFLLTYSEGIIHEILSSSKLNLLEHL